MDEILLPAEMNEADRLAAAAGPFDSYRLMLNAGAAVTDAILARFANAEGFDVLCGPGNNGGDGYVVARLLGERGLNVRLWRTVKRRPDTDAARAAGECPIHANALEDFTPEPGWLVVDALFGAGLSRPLEGVHATALQKVAASEARVVSVDLPSGVSGESGLVLGTAPAADLTVTFFRRKPGHLLYPGRKRCGETLVADIGIAETVLQTIRPRCRENVPALWQAALPYPTEDAHKYERGHVGVFSGGPSRTGAARLAARGAARIGAGAVTLLSPGTALAVNAMHLTSIMLRRVEDAAEFAAFRHERSAGAYVLGPGFGVDERARVFTEEVLAPDTAAHLVLDADGITAFADVPERLFAAAAESRGTLVLTPHMGEFARLFPDLAADDTSSKLAKARQAAARSSAIIVLKGADTVIATPDGEAAINTNATPYLATAGSGDVLSGMIAGLMAGGMPGFSAACAAVFLHCEAGKAVGPGLIAEDLPEALPPVLRSYLQNSVQ